MEENNIDKPQQNQEQPKKKLSKTWKVVIVITIIIVSFILGLSEYYNLEFKPYYDVVKTNKHSNSIDIIIETNVDIKRFELEIRFYDKEENLVSQITKEQTNLRKGNFYTFTFEYKFTDMLETHTYLLFPNCKLKFPSGFFQLLID